MHRYRFRGIKGPARNTKAASGLLFQVSGMKSGIKNPGAPPGKRLGDVGIRHALEKAHSLSYENWLPPNYQSF